MRDQREVERLGVDGEAVAAQAEGAAVVGVQVGAVAQGAGRLLTGGLQSAVQLLRADLVAQFAQLVRRTPDLGDHRVGGEVRADRVGAGERGGAACHGLKDPGRRGGELFGPAGAGVGEGLLACGERLVDLGALVRQLAEEVVEVGEAGFQVLQLDEQAGELLVAGLHAVGGGERAERRTGRGVRTRRRTPRAPRGRGVRGGGRRAWRGHG